MSYVKDRESLKTQKSYSYLGVRVKIKSRKN